MIVHSFELSRKQEPLQRLLPAALVTLPELERMLLRVQLDMIHLLQHFQLDLENRHASKKIFKLESLIPFWLDAPLQIMALSSTPSKFTKEKVEHEAKYAQNAINQSVFDERVFELDLHFRKHPSFLKWKINQKEDFSVELSSPRCLNFCG